MYFGGEMESPRVLLTLFSVVDRLASAVLYGSAAHRCRHNSSRNTIACGFSRIFIKSFIGFPDRLTSDSSRKICARLVSRQNGPKQTNRAGKGPSCPDGPAIDAASLSIDSFSDRTVISSTRNGCNPLESRRNPRDMGIICS